jgi:hypothetical protein
VAALEDLHGEPDCLEVARGAAPGRVSVPRLEAQLPQPQHLRARHAVGSVLVCREAGPRTVPGRAQHAGRHRTHAGDWGATSSMRKSWERMAEGSV